MAKQRLSMRKTREVLRLKFEANLSNRQIARSCNIARSTVADYIKRAQAAGLSWPLPPALTDTALEAHLFQLPDTVPGQPRPLPDWGEIHHQMKRKGVTLALLWQEYRERHHDGYQYSQFAQYYRQWLGTLDVVMRQSHKAGEKLFIDYAGHTVGIKDRHTFEVCEAQIFVATFGASQYTYCEATATQALPDWVASHARAFEFFGGCPELLVPDNLKSAVTKPCRYEPDLNPTYQEMANHYGTAIVPARVRKPQDKSVVENGVQRVEQWILAKLRHHTFFSLHELNEQIAPLLDELNNRSFQKLDGTRRSLFESVDRPLLKTLPPYRYEFAEWSKARLQYNIHIRVDGCYYSAPHTFIKKKLDVRLSAATVELFFKGERIASHPRSYRKGSYTTTPTHMPKKHQAYLEWTPERLEKWAAQNGPHTATLVQALLESRAHPQQAFAACMGVMRLAKSYDTNRLENACRRALHFQTISYKSIESILKHNFDQQPLPEEVKTIEIDHKNLRGSHYYH